MDVDTLRRLMEDGGESQADIARLLAVHPSAISRLFKGERQLKGREVEILRKYFGLKDVEKGDEPHWLPIVGLVSAGTWRDGFEHVRGHMPSPDSSLSPDSFVVIVEGDSMDKVAADGESVIVDPRDLDLVSGKFYVISNGHGETTFKQYLDSPARLVPCSTNEKHRTLYPGQEGFTVIGRVRMKVMSL